MWACAGSEVAIAGWGSTLASGLRIFDPADTWFHGKATLYCTPFDIADLSHSCMPQSLSQHMPAQQSVYADLPTPKKIKYSQMQQLVDPQKRCLEKMTDVHDAVQQRVMVCCCFVACRMITSPHKLCVTELLVDATGS